MACLVREDADDFGAPLDLAVQPFEGLVGAVGPMAAWKVHIGEHVRLGFVHEGGELWQFGTQLIGDLAPLLSWRGPASSCANAVAIKAEATRRPLLPGMGERVAHEMHAAALPTASNFYDLKTKSRQ